MGLLGFPCGWRAAERPEEAAAPRAKQCEGRRRRKASPWRPSLVAISEDGALVGDGATKGRGGRRKLRATPTSGSGVVPRPHKEDHGLYGVAALVPTFAPTAFIF